MMYKDKEKQKQATRERVRRYREKQKGVTSPIGPLDIYSEERWSRLRAKGYEMPDRTQLYVGQVTLEMEIPTAEIAGYARKTIHTWHDANKKIHYIYQWAVPVPGDPAYEGILV